MKIYSLIFLIGLSMSLLPEISRTDFTQMIPFYDTEDLDYTTLLDQEWVVMKVNRNLLNMKTNLIWDIQFDIAGNMFNVHRESTALKLDQSRFSQLYFKFNDETIPVFTKVDGNIDLLQGLSLSELIITDVYPTTAVGSESEIELTLVEI